MHAAALEARKCGVAAYARHLIKGQKTNDAYESSPSGSFILLLLLPAIMIIYAD